MTKSVSAKNRDYTTFRVKNFGPIAKGDITLRPLTVFTGHNNTGKSWYATLIYALLNSHIQSQPWRFDAADAFENSDPSNEPDQADIWRYFDPSGIGNPAHERTDKHETCIEVRHPMHDNSLRMPGKAWYLPAQRSSIMHTHQTIIGALPTSMSKARSPHQLSTHSLPGVMADFLDNLAKLARNESTNLSHRFHHDENSCIRDCADNLEQKILGGQIKIENASTNYPNIIWAPKGWSKPLDIKTASSMVKELTPLVLYLRYCITKGDVLILEQPEAHLHPETQAQLVNQMIDWVNAGIYVVAIIHSEWVLDELSNIVGESKKDKKKGLAQEKVGIWHFKKKRDNGSVIREIQWSKDNGGFENVYQDIAAKQYNKWAALAGEDE